MPLDETSTEKMEKFPLDKPRCRPTQGKPCVTRQLETLNFHGNSSTAHSYSAVALPLQSNQIIKSYSIILWLSTGL